MYRFVPVIVTMLDKVSEKYIMFQSCIRLLCIKGPLLGQGSAPTGGIPLAILPTGNRLVGSPLNAFMQASWHNGRCHQDFVNHCYPTKPTSLPHTGPLNQRKPRGSLANHCRATPLRLRPPMPKQARTPMPLTRANPSTLPHHLTTFTLPNSNSHAVSYKI